MGCGFGTLRIRITVPLWTHCCKNDTCHLGHSCPSATVCYTITPMPHHLQSLCHRPCKAFVTWPLILQSLLPCHCKAFAMALRGLCTTATGPVKPLTRAGALKYGCMDVALSVPSVYGTGPGRFPAARIANSQLESMIYKLLYSLIFSTNSRWNHWYFIFIIFTSQ
jgi:hypothetical protein